MVSQFLQSAAVFVSLTWCFSSLAVSPASARVSLKKIDALGLQGIYTSQFVRAKSNQDKESSTLLRFSIQPQSETQFQQIRQAYGGKSQVKYKPGQTYDLADFLNPGVQTLVNKTFVEIEEKKQDWVEKNFSDLEDQTIYTTTNCYGTAWELTRLFSSTLAQPERFYLFWANRDPVTTYMENPRFSRKILDTEPKKYGDLVLFFERIHSEYRGLLHVAIYVDEGVYFEKTDTGSNYFYRFLTYESMQEKMQNFATPETLEIEHLRFNEPGQEKLPSPLESLSVAYDPTFPGQSEFVPSERRDRIIIGLGNSAGGGVIPGLYGIADVELVIDPNSGRGQFLPSDISQKFKPAAVEALAPLTKR